MIRYNEKKHCFEIVSAEEYMQECFFDDLEKEIKKTISLDEPIRIKFKVEDAFKVKQGDFGESKARDKKDRYVESAMGRICEFQESRYAEKFGMLIEQELQQAYKQGYCDGIDDAPGEDDAYEKGFRDGVTYCKGKVWKISPDKGLETMKMEDSI